MIILHSTKILEQLTEIENMIRKIENYMDENGIEGDREKILLRLLKGQEMMNTSRTGKEK